MQHLDHREVSRVLLKKLLLLIFYKATSVTPWSLREDGKGKLFVPGAATVESLMEPLDALTFVLFDMLARLTDQRKRSQARV